MKRFLSALFLCSTLILLLSYVLFRSTETVDAKDDVIGKLLQMPAPPRPNPLVPVSRKRDDKFYDLKNPPPDNAPIEDLIDFWTHQRSSGVPRLDESKKASARTAERLLGAAAKDPSILDSILRVLPSDERTTAEVKALFDNPDGNTTLNKRELKEWLKFNSTYFTNELRQVADKTVDDDGYVSVNFENHILALATNDFDAASPTIMRLYNDRSQPVSQVLALWALYKHALDTDSLGDIERYRAELMRMVEDRTLSDGVRDKANDALTHEKDFPGRDDWTLSLFEDETLVNMQRFTMLTTLVMYSPSEAYIPKLLVLIERTSNPIVRSAAARTLLLALEQQSDDTRKREIITALLPWLEDPKWADDTSRSRYTLVSKLSEHEIPESVPGLIKVLNERQARRPNSNTASNRAYSGVANAANFAANAANTAANVMRSAIEDADTYQLRYDAVSALAKQKDFRAVGPLRMVLAETFGYQQNAVVKALLACGGFSAAEQVNAIELSAKKSTSPAANAAYNAPNYNYNANIPMRPPTAAEIARILSEELESATEISDETARALVDRIEVLDKRDKPLAAILRRKILRWQNAVINLLLLNDLKNGETTADSVIRLLASRQTLIEKQSSDVYAIKSGTQLAVGTAPCILGDHADAAAIIANGEPESQAALFACARMIRMPLPIAESITHLRSKLPILAFAAEQYLISEDSPEARSAVLLTHPDEAFLTGSMSAFFGKTGTVNTYESETLWQLYLSLGNASLYNGWYGAGNDDDIIKTETELKKEVLSENGPLGIYALEGHYVRIYGDRVIFSWDEDESRFRERPLEKEEFDEIKSYIVDNGLADAPAFIGCGGEYCTSSELLMVGRSGGRRVYATGGPHEVFTGLLKIFERLKRSPATLKYGLSREIPGLEIILADDNYHAETVWGNAADLRIAASLTSVRKNIKAEIEKVAESFGDEDSEERDYIANLQKVQKIVEKRQFDGLVWITARAGNFDKNTIQPTGVEFIPKLDGLPVKPTQEQWKARGTDFEIRASGDGLFKVVRGRMTKLKSGIYGSPVLSANGRWILAARSDEEEGSTIVRIDTLTSKEYPVVFNTYGDWTPKAFIPTANKFLIVRGDSYYYDHDTDSEGDDNVRGDLDAESMMLVDPSTGVVIPPPGEYRPLTQMSFRPLQKGAKPNEFWAALPDTEKRQTVIGIYDINHFGFRPVMTVPKILFNSMGMWVDEPSGKVYFVYRGHVLALPLNKTS